MASSEGPGYDAEAYDINAEMEWLVQGAEHFLEVLTFKGEKEVRLFGDESLDDYSNVFELYAVVIPTVLDRLMQNREQFVHTLALPVGYILKCPLKCTPCPMYHAHRGYHRNVIHALTGFLQRVQKSGGMLRELCVPVFCLHEEGQVAVGLKDLLVAKCMALHIMFVESADPENTKRMQSLFDSVFQSPQVRTICFVANTAGLSTHDGTKDFKPIHAANVGRTFHCFACCRLTGDMLQLYMHGCKNLRWVYPFNLEQQEDDYLGTKYARTGYILCNISCKQDIQALKQICTNELRVLIPCTAWIGTRSDREGMLRTHDTRKVLHELATTIKTVCSLPDQGILFRKMCPACNVHILLDFGAYSLYRSAKEEEGKEMAEVFRMIKRVWRWPKTTFRGTF